MTPLRRGPDNRITVRCNCLLGDAGTSEVVVGDGEEHLIEDDAVFYDAPPKKALAQITGLLENSMRSKVRHVRHGVNPRERKLLEPVPV